MWKYKIYPTQWRYLEAAHVHVLLDLRNLLIFVSVFAFGLALAMDPMLYVTWHMQSTIQHLRGDIPNVITCKLICMLQGGRSSGTAGCV